MNNVVTDSAYAGIKQGLRQELDRWMAENGDYLAGFVDVSQYRK